ncbi:MAG: Nif3-like dinuclear metal center hexameric protein [Lachnospiraceae bacterium]|jgi:dinuclear metal center YbgI/SA1388 family protein|nr:Nif3-like dinuclear metal center hexameric protein [Lachnospiraceae bacterium]MDD3614637.1 Nif3-like dinuclear metal center hexameric protein [Lachnospiraceae bacterium]
MTGHKIIEILKQHWPSRYALEWDNVGLLVGNPDWEAKHILVALDLNDEVLEQAIAVHADMIVTHHPMIFSGMKRVTATDFIGNRILKLAENHIMAYAMHTNFDVLSMADLNAESLKLQTPAVLMQTGIKESGEPVGIGKYGSLVKAKSLEEFSIEVKNALQIPDVRVYGNMEQQICTAAISGGSGKSMIQSALEANADVLVTGDIDYHTGIDALAQGLAIIDAGHYGTEYIFIEYVKAQLEKMFPEITITAAPVKHPFQTI